MLPGEKSKFVRAIASYCLQVSSSPGPDGLVSEMATKTVSKYEQFKDKEDETNIIELLY